MRISMNPPPPMLPAGECTTARANPVATAASTALPPACMISAPACEASACTVTTMACSAGTGRVAANKESALPANTASNKTLAAQRGNDLLCNDLCGNPMPVVQDGANL